jgi:hypothetical protein
MLHSQVITTQVHGKVIDEYNALPVIGCSVFTENGQSGAITDSLGYFVVQIPASSKALTFSHIGYAKFTLSLSQNKLRTPVIVKLRPSIHVEKEIVVAEKRNPDLRVQEMVAKDIYRVPTGFNDVLRGVTFLSGVATNNEMSSGYNVRGGNFNENLIYLNGYEIYRPFLLREGSEENQTLINPDLVDKVDFYNGGFSAAYGDKMSSALAVTYRMRAPDSVRWKIRASLLNAGVSAAKRFGNLDFILAVRYAYPGMLLNSLQTEGAYKPSYSDIQMLLHYQLSRESEFELLFIDAKNTYSLTPTDWVGHIQSDRGSGLANAVQILYNGNRKYSFLTALGALRFRTKLTGTSGLSLSVSANSHSEDDVERVTGDFFYIPNAFYMDVDREYLKTRNEAINDHLRTRQLVLQADYFLEFRPHSLSVSMFKRWNDVRDQVDEQISEHGDVSLLDNPAPLIGTKRYFPNEIGGYILDRYSPNEQLEIAGGLRFVSEQITGEFLVSPRLQASYRSSPSLSFFGAWGYYYQPPYYLEFRNNDAPLVSQRTIHCSAGFEHRFNEAMFLKTELYYKQLNHLIPYYTDGQKIIYTGSNANEGYAYGMDIMFHGEVISGIQSWMGYGYLNTRERPISGGPTVRRLTDQTHSILIFLQDRIKKHSNWQVHTRLLAGSGLLYYDRKIVTDPVTGVQTLAVNFAQPLEYLLYFRADMGCSTEFTLGAGKKLTLTAEVLNVFAQNNYAGYQFIQVFKDLPYPIKVPQVLSPRFFNIQAEYEF